MFHYDNGLKLTAIDLAIDVRRRQPRGFVSHAHSDHIARHELAFCTPATARLYQHRLGPQRIKEMPFGETIDWGGMRLTTHAAGHILGSAMLLADDGETRLLYTGDFKLGPSATAEPAELPRANILIMECTFGDPKYRLPPRERVIEQLVAVVREALASGRTPVIYAYVLGKAQEVTKILTDHGIPVRQHPSVFEISQVYEKCGCSLGDYSLYSGQPMDGHALIAPPQSQRGQPLACAAKSTTIAVTGWAIDRNAKYRLRVDHALPLSDHADYDELLEAVQRVEPDVIYCTHGPASFAERLHELGLNAHVLGNDTQLRLF